jgi:hypothetical protein
MATQNWAETRTPFLVVGLVLSALIVVGSPVMARAAFSGRTVYRDASGQEVRLDRTSIRVFYAEDSLAGIPAAERSSSGTFSHDPSIKWHQLAFAAVALIMGGRVAVGCVTELARRRRMQKSPAG